MATRIKQRRGTASQWTSANPVPSAGEPGFETDTGMSKTGDGATAWDSLGYDARVLTAPKAIAAALAAGRKDIHLPPGTFTFAAGLTGLLSGVSISGAGEDRTRLVFADVADNALEWAGTSTNANLTSNVAVGDTVLNVDSSASATVGGLVMIRPSNIGYGAFTARVKAKTSTTVTLEEPSPISLSTTTHGAYVSYFTSPIKNVMLSDLTIENAASTPTTRVYYLNAAWVENFKVRRCTFRGLGADNAVAMYFVYGRDVEVSHCTVEDISGSTSVQAIRFDMVTGVKVASNTLRRVSSGISLSSCPLSSVSDNDLMGDKTIGRGIRLYVSPGSSATGNVVRNFGATQNGIRVTDSAGAAVVGNTISECGQGITCNEDLRTGTLKGLTVTGNTIRRCEKEGIIFATDASDGKSEISVISANTIDTTGWTLGGTFPGAGITITASDLLVTGNIIRNWPTALPACGIRTNSTSQRNTLRHNIGDNAGAGGMFIYSGGANNRIDKTNIPLNAESITRSGTDVDDLATTATTSTTTLKVASTPSNRTGTDGVTNTDTSFVAASGAFTSADIGKFLVATGVPAGTRINSVTNATTVVLTNATTATATGLSWTLYEPLLWLATAGGTTFLQFLTSGVGALVVPAPGSVGPGAQAVPSNTFEVRQTGTTAATFVVRTASWGQYTITADGSSPGEVRAGTSASVPLKFVTNNVGFAHASTGQDVYLGPAAQTTATELATGATAAFLHVPTVNGTPTGTPAGLRTGATPIVIDRSGSKLWAYVAGAWKSATLA